MNLLGRELHELLSRPRSYWIRSGFLLCLLVGSALLWTRSAETDPNVDRVAQGRTLYTFFCACAFAIALLVLPSFAMNAISSERRSGTLDVLLVSPLLDREIVQQKVLSRLILLGLLLTAAIPFSLLCSFLGGVSLYDLWMAPLRCVAAGAFLSAFALSSSLRHSDARWTWFVTAQAIVVTPLAVMTTAGRRFGLVAGLLLLLSAVDVARWAAFPLWTLAAGFLDPTAHPLRDVSALIACGIGTMLYGRMASQRLREEPRSRDASVKRSERFRYGEEDQSRRRKLLRWVAGGRRQHRERTFEQNRRVVSVTPLSPLRQRISRLFDDPFLDQELRSQRTMLEEFGNAFALIATTMGLLAFGAAPHSFWTDGPRDLHLGILWFTLQSLLLISCFLAVLRGSTTLARARRSGLLSTLSISPMSGSQLVKGLTLSTLWTLRHLWLPTLWVALPVSMFNRDLALWLSPFFVCLGGILGLHALALLVSLAAPNERSAQTFAIAALYLPLLLAPLVDNLLAPGAFSVLLRVDVLWVLPRASSPAAWFSGLGWLTLGLVVTAGLGATLDRWTGRRMDSSTATMLPSRRKSPATHPTSHS